MDRRARYLLVAAALLWSWSAGSGRAEGSFFSIYYGDDDGFGLGAVSGALDPSTSHASIGEAPLTDVRLIGGSPTMFPALEPTGDFTPVTLPPGAQIISATLTMRVGAWVSGPDPRDGTNRIVLDGQAVPAGFLALFTANTGNELAGGDRIETHSVSLDASFFPLLASGTVSLAGTRLSESVGDGSFQVDFLRLDLQTVAPPAVPAPTSLALVGLGGLLLTAARKRRAGHPPIPQ